MLLQDHGHYCLGDLEDDDTRPVPCQATLTRPYGSAPTEKRRIPSPFCIIRYRHHRRNRTPSIIFDVKKLCL